VFLLLITLESELRLLLRAVLDSENLIGRIFYGDCSVSVGGF